MLRVGAQVLRGTLRVGRIRSASAWGFNPCIASTSSGAVMKSVHLGSQVNYMSRRQFSSSSSSGSGNSSSEKGDAAAAEADASDEMAVIEKEFESPGAMSQIAIPEFFPNVPVIAITRYPLFPGFIKKVDIIKDEGLKDVIRRRIKLKQPYAGVFVKKDDENKEESVSSLSDLHSVGSFVQIIEMKDHGNVLELVLCAHRRIRLLESLQAEEVSEEKTTHEKLQSVNLNKRRAGKARAPPTPLTPPVTPPASPTGSPSSTPTAPERQCVLIGKTENVTAEPVERNNETKAKMQAIVKTIRDAVQLNPLFGQQINLLLHPQHHVIENPVYLCDLVATIVQSADTAELQEVMDELSVAKRLDLALVLVEKEKAVAKLKTDINKDVEKKVQDQHRKYMLTEQLKVIKKELGLEKDDKSSIIEKMEARLKGLVVPEYAMSVIKEEQQKLQFLDPHSSEFSVTRNYLDWLTNVPWGIVSEENRDLEKARKELEAGHYGMKDVKERILEFIAVNILRKNIGGKILCLHGPPGVGKTSIAKSIAAALNREYYRFSVGGMTDVAEIKGHRRTYVGAMPGKMIQCLKKVKTENPLVLIDEVDKMGRAGFHGDPGSALLELLDPEQNANFNDHFLDVPVDLSKVLFICTANQLDTISGPLRDRMELIDVSGYLAEEKLAIAQTYLIPLARKDTSLTEAQLVIKDSALETLIKQYCRESGVRNLQKHIEKVFRKAALQIAGRKEGDPDALVTVDSDTLEKYVGRPKFTSDRMYQVTPPGVIMGLAWTSMGGSALYIEAVLKKAIDEKNEKDGSLETTGNLGDVMKESVRTALTVAKGILSKEQPENRFLDKAHIHIHVPEGATPKDGPSAGVTLVSSLLSLALNRPACQDMAMTGEISLTGLVLPVGGIREKVIAARRVGAKRIFLPAENRRDFDELPQFMKDDIDVRFVSHYRELYEHLFE